MREVIHHRPYWVQMRVPFTSTVGEQTGPFTDSEGFDTLIRGAWSDLLLARVRFVRTSSKNDYSDVQVPIAAQAGSSNTTQPMMLWDVPVVLPARAPIQGQFLNSGGEGPGTVAFIGEKLSAEKGQHIAKVNISQQFWLMLELGNASGISRTDPIDDDCLIWGATTNCADAIEVIIRDTGTRITWSQDEIPVRALAGLDGSIQPVMWYPRPMLLKKYLQLAAQVNTPVTGNYIAFRAERITDPPQQVSYDE